jgi:hypothetical protein
MLENNTKFIFGKNAHSEPRHRDSDPSLNPAPLLQKAVLPVWIISPGGHHIYWRAIISSCQFFSFTAGTFSIFFCVSMPTMPMAMSEY